MYIELYMYRIYIEYIKYSITAILLFVKKKQCKNYFSFNHYSCYFSNMYR